MGIDAWRRRHYLATTTPYLGRELAGQGAGADKRGARELRPDPAFLADLMKIPVVL